jgi:hypothetical protein
MSDFMAGPYWFAQLLQGKSGILARPVGKAQPARVRAGRPATR